MRFVGSRELTVANVIVGNTGGRAREARLTFSFIVGDEVVTVVTCRTRSIEPGASKTATCNRPTVAGRARIEWDDLEVTSD